MGPWVHRYPSIESRPSHMWALYQFWRSGFAKHGAGFDPGSNGQLQPGLGGRIYFHSQDRCWTAAAARQFLGTKELQSDEITEKEAIIAHLMVAKTLQDPSFWLISSFWVET